MNKVKLSRSRAVQNSVRGRCDGRVCRGQAACPVVAGQAAGFGRQRRRFNEKVTIAGAKDQGRESKQPEGARNRESGMVGGKKRITKAMTMYGSDAGIRKWKHWGSGSAAFAAELEDSYRALFLHTAVKLKKIAYHACRHLTTSSSK